MITIGQRVASYRVVRLIGRGGMGLVYEAVHEAIGRRAAIKILHPELSADPLVASRFLNEARAANLVRHPGLVEIFEFGRLADGAPFIIMDFLDGESLADALKRDGGDALRAEALDVIRQLAAALAAAHARGIVHRDLKPENVMLIPDVERPGRRRAKILDFGIAKLAAPDRGDSLSESGPARTRPGVAMGTPAYMAPEQCLGAEQIDGQADVYSLGVLFYEVLSGRRPFEAPTPLEVMTLHVRAAPPPLRIPGLDPRIVLLIEAMLAKAPGDRPTLQAVAETITGLAATPVRAPSAAATGPRPVSAPGVTASSPAPPSSPPLDRGAPQLDHTLPALERPDPFIAGPPIADPRQFFGRQREIKRLFNLWRRPPLQNAAIIGPTRSGKTSLLHYLKNILTARELRPDQRNDLIADPGRYRFLLVDFQDPRMGTEEGLLRHILRGLGLRAPATVDLESFMAEVAEQLQSPAIILFDEIGVAVQRYRELDTAFWEGLRALAINAVGGNLGFVLASNRPPHELSQQLHDGGSPFFNIFGYSATLGPLTEAEARQLIASAPLPFAEADIQWILEQSGLWPLLLQILARERLHALHEGDKGTEWRSESLRQLAPFRHLLQGETSR
ncbi:MAG: protein kinase [Polyangia bacterium]